MSSSPTVLFVAGDPGGAAALMPVIKKWRGEKILAGYRQALGMFRVAGYDPRVSEDKAGTVAAADFLKETHSDLVLGATSINGTNWEPHFFAAARCLGLPSLSLLDYGSNYTPRYTRTVPLDSLPNAIAVMDEHVRDEMIAEGFPQGSLFVTGQPVLDEAREWFLSQPPDIRLKCREKIGIPADAKLVLFVSQPLGDMGALTGKPFLNEFDALDSLVEKVKGEGGSKLTQIMIKLHPREPETKYDQHIQSFGSLVAVAPSSVHKWELCLAASEVVGISSMLLLEAEALGCRVTRVDEEGRMSTVPVVIPGGVSASFPLACASIFNTVRYLLRSGACKIHST